MMKNILMPAALLALTGCVISTAPLTVALRSNTHQQTAEMDGKNDNQAGQDAVNADRKTALETAVSTATGAATTNGSQTQEAERKEAAPAKETTKSVPVESGKVSAEAAEVAPATVTETVLVQPVVVQPVVETPAKAEEKSEEAAENAVQ